MTGMHIINIGTYLHITYEYGYVHYGLILLLLFLTGSYNNFFRMFERSGRKEVTFEASREIAKPKTMLKPRKVSKFLSAITELK